MRFLVFLLQDFIVRTDRSQSHLESLADVHPIHSWAGMNAECQSPASGNTEGGGGGGGYRFIVTEGNPSAFCCRLLPSLVLPFNEKTDFCLPQRKRHHYKFITASQKENIILLNNSMYIITMHFLYKAVCI